MNYQVKLFQGPEGKYIQSLPLQDLIQKSLSRQLGKDINGFDLRVAILNVPEDIIINGTPIVENLVPEFGYAYVTLSLGNRIVYRHPHPISDILTQTLQSILRERYPSIDYWYFRIDIPLIPGESRMRRTPHVQGTVPVRPFGPGEKPAFSIRRIAEEEPPIRTLQEFAVDMEAKHKPAKIKVLLPTQLEHDLYTARPLSNSVEEGGFLLGNVYRDGDTEGSYILEIKAAPFAEYTGASFFHFTYTGDSFAVIKRTLREERPGERLLGWFHTHLFPATDELGLTSIDVVLHFGTFTIPWQVAGLINLDFEKNQRVLRFYVREGNKMVLIPFYKLVPPAAREPF
jgi:hypothetical protein